MTGAGRLKGSMSMLAESGDYDISNLAFARPARGMERK